jgi:hypothetical protein
MKVKVAIQRTIEVEVDNPAVEELDAFWRTTDIPIPMFDLPTLDELIDEAVKAIEEVVGIPFGNGEVSENICGVYTMDGDPIIEE